MIDFFTLLPAEGNAEGFGILLGLPLIKSIALNLIASIGDT